MEGKFIILSRPHLPFSSYRTVYAYTYKRGNMLPRRLPARDLPAPETAELTALLQPQPIPALLLQHLPAQDLPAPETIKLTALLLQSQPTSALVRKPLADYVRYVHDFPTHEEEARGTVQVWGRGETGPSHSPTLSDPGDITLDPAADFSEAVVQMYIKSYVENIQSMYPLLTPSELRAMPSPEGESIRSALTLLVLALGKICLYPRIPDVMPLEKGSLQGGSARRNMDVIPGLDYFACASRIFGRQLAGNSLTHIQVDLLAGLYYGQLVRPVESYTFVRRASHKLQQAMRR